jgi:AcrR family transcriptional regulator
VTTKTDAGVGSAAELDRSGGLPWDRLREARAEHLARWHQDYLEQTGERGENCPHPAGLRERKKIATRRALSEAAMRLAIERGLDNVLVEDIAEAAGVSARTFNNYFASKYEAICALSFDRSMRIGTALRERPAGEPLWTAITSAVMSEFGNADQALDPDLMAGIRLVIWTPALRGESLRVQAMTQYALAEAIAMRSGARRAGPMFPRILAGAVMTAVNAALHQWIESDPPIAMAPLIRQALQELADGMLWTLTDRDLAEPG